MPFGAPSVDQYGGDRPGDNLFGTSLVAARADTGEAMSRQPQERVVSGCELRILWGKSRRHERRHGCVHRLK